MKLNRRWFLSVAVIAIIGQSCSSSRITSYSTEDELYGGSVNRTSVVDNSMDDYATSQPVAEGLFEPDPSTQYEMPVTGGSDLYSDDYYGGDIPITDQEMYYDDVNGDTYINNYYYDDFAYSSRIRRFRRGYGTGYYDPYYTDPYWYTMDALYLTSALYSSFVWGHPTWSMGWNPWYGWNAGWSWGYGNPYWGYGAAWRPWRYGYGCGWRAPAYAWCPSYYGCGGGYGWSGGYGTWAGLNTSGYHYGHRGGNLGGYSYNPGSGSGRSGGGTRVVSDNNPVVGNNLDSRTAIKSTNKATAVNPDKKTFNNGNSKPSINSVKSASISGPTRSHTSGLNGNQGSKGLTSNDNRQTSTANKTRNTTGTGWGTNSESASPTSTMSNNRHIVRKTRGTNMQPYTPGNTGRSTTRSSWSSGSTRNTVKRNTQTVKPTKPVQQTRTYKPVQKPKYNNNSYNPTRKSTSVPKVKSTPSVKPRSNFNQRVIPRKPTSTPRKTYSAPRTSSSGGGYRPSRSTPSRSVGRSSGNRSNTMRRR